MLELQRRAEAAEKREQVLRDIAAHRNSCSHGSLQKKGVSTEMEISANMVATADDAVPK